LQVAFIAAPLMLDTDFALASGGTLTLANYFLIGWFNGEIDKFYMQSWNSKCSSSMRILKALC
jgi:hypothetical protein